jgi:hypothetical protein
MSGDTITIDTVWQRIKAKAEGPPLPLYDKEAGMT